MREGNQNSGNITQYSTGYLQVASGTTAQRPSSPVLGMIRFNADLPSIELYQAGTWQSAASTNTASSFVLRDANGAFSAATITLAAAPTSTLQASTKGYVDQFNALVTQSISGNTTVGASVGVAMGVVFTGTLTAAATITFPVATRVVFVANRTTGGFPITITNGGTTTGYLQAGLSGTFANDASGFTRLSLTAPPTLLVASLGGGDGSATAWSLGAGAFSTMPLATVSTDTAAGFSTSTYKYTIPYTGVYQIATKMRGVDSTTANVSYGQGAHTSNVDGTWFQWFTSSSATSTKRNGSLNLRFISLNKGDQINAYAYSDSAMSIAAAEMNISLITAV